MEDTLESHVNNANKFSFVRKHARSVIKYYELTRRCTFCSDDEFVDVLEVAHIKPIAKFSMGATIGQINSRDNLIYICPSHHAMMDKELVEV
jgi:predicted restriction endonuclease